MDLSRLLSGLCREGPQPLTTIIHGELWENNVLLANDSCFAGDGVKIVDWKNAKVASATLDLVSRQELAIETHSVSIETLDSTMNL